MKEQWTNPSMQKKYKEGDCVVCPAGTKAFRAHYCEKHWEKVREQEKQRKQKRLTNGCCILCNTSPLASKTLCFRCKEKARVYAREYRIKKGKLAKNPRTQSVSDRVVAFAKKIKDCKELNGIVWYKKELKAWAIEYKIQVELLMQACEAKEMELTKALLTQVGIGSPCSKR